MYVSPYSLNFLENAQNRAEKPVYVFISIGDILKSAVPV